MKSIRYLFAIFTFLQLSSVVFAAPAWQELKGEHFIVYFKNNESFVKDVLNKAENCYRNVADQLGYARYSEFWLWDKRVKIYIYPDHASYVKSSGHPEWSQGLADYTNKEIVSFAWSKGFLESLLPHEIGHLTFRDFVGFKGEVPLWLDEGVAQWLEQTKRRRTKLQVRRLYDKGGLSPLRQMMSEDIRNIKGDDPLDKARVDNFYAQAFSLVDFLISRHGSNDFVNFCRQLRDGKSLQQAIASAYSNYMRSLSDLEKNWLEYMRENY